ncbi:hypothetical protein BaRGS_00019853 [Batillaria attramentaria]|uniref:Hexosyltransferase n=1 Tax=Batillaria attramentaria TaxID=370345 RepID=A0ABD0KP10_9CAEN
MNLTEDEVPSHLPLTLAPDYQYLLMNPNLCGTDQVDVLFIVHVRPSSLEKRAVLRATTCNESFFAPFKVRTLFLLGSVPNATLQALLEAEHRLYGDTLQGRFHDHYHNLSQKGVMGFNWITHYCPHVRYVFKMDDDAFVDTFKLLNK